MTNSTSLQQFKHLNKKKNQKPKPFLFQFNFKREVYTQNATKVSKLYETYRTLYQHYMNIIISKTYFYTTSIFLTTTLTHPPIISMINKDGIRYNPFGIKKQTNSIYISVFHNRSPTYG